MPTLYVENVPEVLYTALRTRAREHRRSISAEVLALLAENVPTPDELARRRDLLNIARRLRSTRVPAGARHQTAEEMQREDRNRWAATSRSQSTLTTRSSRPMSLLRGLSPPTSLF